MLKVNHWRTASGTEQEQLLRRPEAIAESHVHDAAQAIVTAIRAGGDDTVRRRTLEFDGVDIATTKVDQQEFHAAENALTSAQLDAIELAIRNVRKFHEAQRPATLRVETMPGVLCERISHPIDAVGLYVPAGTAPLPSTAIMLAIPAVIAACPAKILCTPPRRDGTADPAVLVAASRSGIDEVYKIGGAQAIAAMAYGTQTVPKVHKIFGPGNTWVTAAKVIVSADANGAAIDMPAGPSEVLVIADQDANAEFIAADLLSQAEHGADSQTVLLSTCEKLAAAVVAQVETQLATLSRSEIALQAIAHSRIIVVDDLDTAIQVSNRYAPEHLIMHTNTARESLADVRNAGSVFIGPWSPESVGDYCSGTNHVLPTYGHAMSYSGLGVDQFLRHMTVQELSSEGLQNIGTAVVELAGMEGLDAHAAAIRYRLDALEQQ